MSFTLPFRFLSFIIELNILQYPNMQTTEVNSQSLSFNFKVPDTQGLSHFKLSKDTALSIGNGE